MAAQQRRQQQQARRRHSGGSSGSAGQPLSLPAPTAPFPSLPACLQASLSGSGVFALRETGPTCSLDRPGVRGQKIQAALPDNYKMVALNAPAALVVSAGWVGSGGKGGGGGGGCWQLATPALQLPPPRLLTLPCIAPPQVVALVGGLDVVTGGSVAQLPGPIGAIFWGGVVLPFAFVVTNAITRALFKDAAVLRVRAPLAAALLSSRVPSSSATVRLGSWAVTRVACKDAAVLCRESTPPRRPADLQLNPLLPPPPPPPTPPPPGPLPQLRRGQHLLLRQHYVGGGPQGDQRGQMPLLRVPAGVQPPAERGGWVGGGGGGGGGAFRSLCLRCWCAWGRVQPPAERGGRGVVGPSARVSGVCVCVCVSGPASGLCSRPSKLTAW